MEFEAQKLELVHKQEKQDLLRARLEEAARLKQIMERQLDEALEALKEEREQKNGLRREISSLAFQHCGSSSTVELHLEQLDSPNSGEQEEQDSAYKNGQGSGGPVCHGSHLAPAPGLVSDLLSELHHSESRDLKQQLLQVAEPGLEPIIAQLASFLVFDPFCFWFQFPFISAFLSSSLMS